MYLSSNPNAIHLLETNQDYIDWYMLSKNPNAIHLLEANQKKIEMVLIMMGSENRVPLPKSPFREY